MPTIIERVSESETDECVDVSDTTSKTQSMRRPSSSSGGSRLHGGEGRRGDFSRVPGTPDRIHALDRSTIPNDADAPPAPFSPRPAHLARGERADYLPEFTRVIGRKVTLYRRQHVPRARTFGRFKATRTHACTVLLDTASPATLIQHTVWQRMIACGAASCDGLATASRRKGGGFHGVPLVTSSRVGLNVQMGGDRGVEPGDCHGSTVCLAVHAHVVLNEAITPAALLGLDNWAEFPVQKYVDISEWETVVTFKGRDSDATASAKRYSDWVNNAVRCRATYRRKRSCPLFRPRYHMPNAMSLVRVSITNTDGTAAAEGSKNIRFDKGWSPREAVVEAGTSDIPLRRADDQVFFMQQHITLGTGGAPLIKSDLSKSQITLPLTPFTHSRQLKPSHPVHPRRTF